MYINLNWNKYNNIFKLYYYYNSWTYYEWSKNVMNILPIEHYIIYKKNNCDKNKIINFIIYNFHIK